MKLLERKLDSWAEGRPASHCIPFYTIPFFFFFPRITISKIKKNITLKNKVPRDELSDGTIKICLGVSVGNFEIVTLLPCSDEWALVGSFSSQHSLICPGSFLSLTILRAPCSLGASLFFSLFFGIPWLHLVERSANQSQSPNRVNKNSRYPVL